MPTRDTATRPNGASLAVLPRKNQAADSGRGADSPAERIRHAEELLRELLLANDFDEENSFLCGDVSDRLEQIQLQLSDVAGKQELYELWVGR